jgi:cell division protein FtsI (penicillin-binding protein 3)
MSAAARASRAEPTPPGDRAARTSPSRPLRAVPGRTRTTGPAPRVSPPRTATGRTPAPELRLLPGGAARSRRADARRRAPFALALVALLVLTTIGLLVLNTAIAVNSLRATELRTANAEKAEEVQELEQQVVSGSTPAQLAAAAVAAGLVPAGAAGHLVVGDDGTAVLRGAPEPAPVPGAPEGEG